MRLKTFILISLLTACVDRIDFELGPSSSPVVVTGFISNEPGPYTVEVSRAIESDDKESIKKRISVKRMIISDNAGLQEELSEMSTGIYQTSPSGIQGKVGNTYTLRVEFLDGSIYESKPESLRPAGSLQNVYFLFTDDKVNGEPNPGFDIYFDASAGDEVNYRYMWKLISTFQIETNPELHTKPSGQTRVPDPRPCSGYIVNTDGTLEQTGPCDCCTCWISTMNTLPVISDNILVQNGKFQSVKIGRIPIDNWIFQIKVNARVRQQSLSPAAFSFWKAVVSQKEATGSLFQPITGGVPTNFVQVSGEPGNIEGLFYATGISYKSIFIRREDVPDQSILKDPLTFAESCLQFSNNSTNQMPSFWE